MHRRQVKLLNRLMGLSSREHLPLQKSFKTLGVGVAPFMRCTTDAWTLTTAADIPAACPLAAIPDTSVWTVASVHDSDVEGLMPTLETCRAAFPPGHEGYLFDVFYLALYFAINACRSSSSTWSEWQLQQTSPKSFRREEEGAAALFLRSLSQFGLTPPLQLFLSMRDYTLSHSCRMSQDGRVHLPEAGQLLAVMPLIDIALTKDDGKGNLSLQRCDARQVRSLIRAQPLLYVRQGLRTQRDMAGYWVLQTTTSVSKGGRLALWQAA